MKKVGSATVAKILSATTAPNLVACVRFYPFRSPYVLSTFSVFSTQPYQSIMHEY